jgi:mono/diheme cytochrome c family protein
MLEVRMKMLDRKWGVRIGFGVVGVLLAIQAIPYGGAHTNPPITSEPSWDTPATRVLAKRACFDCHSNETEWPAYASFAPVSWLVQHDVDEGRAVLNFSEWTRPQKDAKEAPEEITQGEMPPAAYLLVHGHARLSEADRDRLAQGLAKTVSVGPQQARP